MFNRENFNSTFEPEDMGRHADVPLASPERVKLPDGLPRGVPPAPEPDFAPKKLDSAKNAARLEEIKKRKAEFEAKLKASKDKAKIELVSRQSSNEARAEKERGVESLNWQEQGEKLNKIVARIAEKQKSMGFPVGQDGRINMDEYADDNLYGSVLAGDLMAVKEFKESENKVGGELMEKIAAALFNKYLPELICARTAKFDDFNPGKDKRSGFDTVLFLNGAIVALSDEFFDDGGKNNVLAIKKINKVDEINKLGGGRIKYSFRQNEGKVSFGPETGVPVFVFVFDSDTMNGAIDGFKSGDGEQNGAEKMAAYKLVDSLYAQIEKMEIQLRGGLIMVDPRFGGDASFKTRLNSLKIYLEQKIPCQTVRAYLAERIEKSKKGSPKKRRS